MALRPRKENSKVLQAEEESRSIEINAEMQGDLIFKDSVNIKINKNFKGSLNIKGTLAIGESSVVEANIVGDNVIIAGKVNGNVTASKMLVLMPSAVLSGNVMTHKLNIVEGAVFNGHCQVIDGLLDVTELANYLQIEMQEIERMAASGEIPGVKNGEVWHFDKSKIDDWASAEKVS